MTDSQDMRFARAVKPASWLRMAICGPTGSGKTFTALTLATNLGARVGMIDTERGSSLKYADLFKFDVLELEQHSPTDYRRAIDEAIAESFDVLVIDGVSHEWMGKNGILEQVDAEAAKIKNSAWRTVTPKHVRFLDAIATAPMHVVATMRTKTEWIQEDEKDGKRRIRRVGTVPVQREGVEYEFDVIAEMEPDRNRFTVAKTRCPALVDLSIERPGPELAEKLAEWLKGEATPFARAVGAVMRATTLADLAAAAELAKTCSDRDRDRIKPIYAVRRDRLQHLAAGGDLPPDHVCAKIDGDDGRTHPGEVQ